MIYKFKSPAAGDLIMLGPQGDELLRLLGRDPAGKGIIENADMPAALQALQEAVARAEAAGQQPAGDDGDAAIDGKAVGLRQRLWPMIEMLKRAHAERADIVWGV